MAKIECVAQYYEGGNKLTEGHEARILALRDHDVTDQKVTCKLIEACSVIVDHPPLYVCVCCSSNSFGDELLMTTVKYNVTVE